jgi:DNA polymerase Ligase (LigD)
MPRFAILEHDYPHRHWDLLLEAADQLRSWRLAAEPRAGTTTRADAIASHRLLYLDYEGPIAGARGSVTRWDGGCYTGNVNGEADVTVDLEGLRYRGTIALELIDGLEWLATFGSEA